MNLINTVLGIPLGYIIYLSYQLTGNFGLSVVIFAFIVRAILFPINLITHKNSVRLLQLQPQLDRIKRRYAGDKERQSEAQHNLFKAERYNPFIGILPLFLQLFVLLGVLQVMYHPMQHIMHLSPKEIASYTREVANLPGYIQGSGEQLYVIETLGLIDLSFVGVNLGTIPSFANPSIELVVPALSGLSAYVYCLFQNSLSPGALSQSKRTNIILTVVTVGFSVYFAAVTPCGVGIYWTLANIFSIGVIFLLELLYSPKELATDALAHIRASQKTPQQMREENALKKTLKLREKEDVSRWNAADKRLVFYALSGGQYKYCKATIDYLLEHSDIVIHYLTNDPDDNVFKLHESSDHFVAYYASQQRTISLLLQLDADIMVTTVQDLQVYHMKRSVARNDIEYIHIPHGPMSLHLTAKEYAYDHFDTVFCTGPHQAGELRRREEMASLPKKNLVKVGYGLFDDLIQQYTASMRERASASEASISPQILIAPSWQDECILDICIDVILESLVGNGWRIIIRPHPQFAQLYPERIDELSQRYADAIKSGELALETDFSSSSSVFLSDVLITDWSGIAFEFSFCTLKPAIFVNTPMKVLNPRYKEYNLEVTDITLRDKVGVCIDVDDVCQIHNAVEKLLGDKDSFKEQIEQVIADYIFYPGRSGEAGGRYIMSRLTR